MTVLSITPTLGVDESEIQIDFIRGSGPGGQNINKVSTAVQLRFDVGRSLSLSPEVKERLIGLAGNRISGEGILIIEARQHRTQEQNRRAAILRLVDLLHKAAEPPQPRYRTRPTRASVQKRLEGKRQRGTTKRMRRWSPTGEE